MTKFEPIDARTLSITPLPPVRWLIPDLLSSGLSLLSGGSKVGKSWLCLWLCLQLAKGGELWGRPLRAQAVLYLCLEDTYARIQNRLFHLSEEEMPDSLYFQTACEGLGHGLEEQIEQFLASARTPGWWSSTPCKRCAPAIPTATSTPATTGT